MNKEHEPNRVRFQVPGQALTQGAAGRRDGEPRLPRPALSLAAPQAPAPRGSTNGGSATCWESRVVCPFAHGLRHALKVQGQGPRRARGGGENT